MSQQQIRKRRAPSSKDFTFLKNFPASSTEFLALKNKANGSKTNALSKEWRSHDVPLLFCLSQHWKAALLLETSSACITVGISVESARPLELAHQSTHRHPPIISSIDFSILMEIVSVREIPKTLLFLWVLRFFYKHLKVFGKMLYTDLPGFSSIMPCTLLTNSDVVSESAER
ncbi:hypothetical protein ACTXT7_012278 [Hymenolepis weldensis]